MKQLQRLAIAPAAMKKFKCISSILSIGLIFAALGWARDLPQYALILSDPPPIRARTQSSDRAVESARAQVKATQRRLMGELNARGIRITGAANTLLNAVFVAASPEDAARLSSIPDRKSTRLNSSHSGESRMPSSA